MRITIKIILALLAVVICFSSVYANDNGSLNLWDHVVKMEQIIISVEHNGRRLNVWKEDAHGYSRFFVTPICVMDTNSVKCMQDRYSHTNRFAFSFYVQLWDLEAAKVVQLKLEKKGFSVDINDIMPLPMQMVKLSINRDQLSSEVKLDNNIWKPNQDQPNRILFELGLTNQTFCDEMVSHAISDPEEFLSSLKLYFKFTMVVNQQASRNFSITGKTIANSKIFANLDNNYSNKTTGLVYLQSSDVNDLSRDIYNTLTISDEITSDYIEPEKENQIILELFNEIKGQQIPSSEITKDEWNSVFWDDIFARPDIQTEYFNETLTYDSGTKHFKYDKTKDEEFRQRTENRFTKEDYKKTGGGGGFSFLGFGVNAGIAVETGHREGNENNVDSGSKNITSISEDKLQTFIDTNKANVKWTGEKFEPKTVNLHRINTKTLQSSGQILYKRVVTTKLATTQELQIRASPEYAINSSKSSNLIFYENFKAEIEKINEKLEARQELYNLLNHTSVKNKLLFLIECSNTTITVASGKDGYGRNQDVDRLVAAIGNNTKKPFDKNYVRLVNYMGRSITLTISCNSSFNGPMDTVTIKDGGEMAFEFADCFNEATRFRCNVTSSVGKHQEWEVYSYDPINKAHNWFLYNNAIFKGNYDTSQREKILDYKKTSGASFSMFGIGVNSGNAE